MPAPIDSDSLAEPAEVEKATPPRSSKRRGGKTVSTRKSSKGGRPATSTLRVKVGGHTITMPASLGSNLTAKDKKKLLALFKRVIKREKKRAAKERVAKKR